MCSTPDAVCSSSTECLLCPLQDMSSLMHTIYDVVDASVNHSGHSKSKTLRVKLTVTPEPKTRRRETISSGPGERHWPKQSYWHMD